MSNINEINGEIGIKEDDINKNIRIINSFEEYMRDFISEDSKYDLYKNEKEIKEKCKIKINNEIIPFSYFYKFKKKGKYNIKYSFTDNITKLNNIFTKCKNLIIIDLSNLNTYNVTNMSNMFRGCDSLTSIILSNTNTQNVTNMSNMFRGCNSLTSIDLSNFNTQNVTDMSYMFNGCNSLTNIDLSNFNTQNIIDMNNMFIGCNSLIKNIIIPFNS